MPRLQPLLVALCTATALSLVPMSFGALPAPVGIGVAQAAGTVNIDVFFQPLASHGVWVKHPQYHYVFCPKVDTNWRPYSHGHWLYMKNYGWYFASDEPFAWAVYHYGRWFRDDKVGWCWVPGNAWAGAWVAWRRGTDYLGWAPLQPARDGFSVDVDINTSEPPQPDWIFVPPKQFLQPKLDVVVLFGDQHPDAFQKTQYAGPVVVQNNIVVNTVIDVNFIQQQTNTKVTVLDPKPVTDPSQAAPDASGNTIAIFAPQIAPPKQTEAPQQSVDENQAGQQIGNASSSAASSSSSSSGEMSSSSEASSGPASSSSEQPASSSSAPASSSAAASSSSSIEPSSSAAAPASSSAAAPVASSAEQVSSSSSIEPSSSAPAKLAPFSEAKAPSSSSSEEPVVSSSSAEPKASSSAEPKAASSAEPAKPKTPAPLVCPKGEELVKGACVPISGSGDNAKSGKGGNARDASSSAAQ